jgi:hypothetical protein
MSPSRLSLDRSPPQWQSILALFFLTKHLSPRWLPVLAMILIPLEESSQWKPFLFSNVAPNKVEFQDKQLKISVNNSASPLLYALKKPLWLESFLVKAKIEGDFPELKCSGVQGFKKCDDFILRFGLIVQGEKRLNWIQRQLAPEWLVEMEKQVPKAMGIEKVRFYSTCRQKKRLNEIRKHYMSSKFEEECITFLEGSKEFQLQKKLAQPVKVIGLWVGSDGDDLNESFELKIEAIQLNDNKKSL